MDVFRQTIRKRKRGRLTEIIHKHGQIGPLLPKSFWGYYRVAPPPFPLPNTEVILYQLESPQNKAASLSTPTHTRVLR